jgi:hypothetical protein
MPMWRSNHGLPERPSWANDAFVYLTLRHAAEIQETMLATGTRLYLQSKHILVSEEYKDLVQDVLSLRIDGPGREAFLTRRAGMFAQSEEVSEVVLRPSSNQKMEVSDFPCFTVVADDQFCMQVDEDLLEFMTVPSVAQSLNPEMHVAVWTAMCEESRDPTTGECWLEMRDASVDLGTPLGHPTPDDPVCPFCKRCETWAESVHLTSMQCRSISNGGQPRVILDAIIAAADRVAWPLDELEVVRGGGEECMSHRARTSLMSERQFQGRCPKPGCTFPIGNRVSDTHCCKRCCLSHEAGKEHGLRWNPDKPKGRPNAERWKKSHGPECTSHILASTAAYCRSVPSSSSTGFDASAPIFTPSLAGTPVGPSVTGELVGLDGSSLATSQLQ